MGEVAEMFDVKPSLLRHWETQFPILRPKRNKKGNRLFTPQDVENLKQIYHLVKERGMTLEGAKKALRGERAEKRVNREAKLMEHLLHIRSLLEEVRADLQVGEGDILPEKEERVPTPRPQRRQVASAPKLTEEPLTEPAAEPLSAEEPTPDTQTPARKPRRKRGEPENKELFAFYEQSLF